MCDRTQEFLRLTGQQKSKTSSDPPVIASKKTPEVPKTKTAFNEAASEIARGIHKTSALLTKLSNLVRRQGLFDDPTDEINNLIYRIKQDLDELNGKCDSAQQYIESKKSMFSDQNQSSAHNVKVVSHLKTDLMHTTKSFKSVLEMRSSKMKDQQSRRVELIGNGILSPLRSLEAQQQNQSKNQAGKSGSVTKDGIATGSAGVLTSNSLVKRAIAPKLPSPYGDPYGVSNSSNSFFTSSNMEQQQQQLLLDPIAETQYFDAREKAVTEVEKTIGELGTLFTRLSTMISEQQELVERVDEDIESATTDANNAHGLLMKAYEKASSNSGMYMKLFAILAIFVLFFTLFLM